MLPPCTPNDTTEYIKPCLLSVLVKFCCVEELIQALNRVPGPESVKNSLLVIFCDLHNSSGKQRHLLIENLAQGIIMPNFDDLLPKLDDYWRQHHQRHSHGVHDTMHMTTG